MELTYIHLSDIHFGQESGGRLRIHNDVKERLLVDARNTLDNLGVENANGVIVTGDIAYSGTKEEYDEAASYLDKLVVSVGCEKTSVQLVPGNHDVDRSKIDEITQHLLTEISTSGEAVLDNCLENKDVRKLLYGRFHAYMPFAEGYDCSMNGEGGIACDNKVELAPGKYLRFYGLNSALGCSKERDEEGKLLLGARQRVLPINSGEELVVLSHHPLNWMLDKGDALKYIKNRARVFISGHEHMPSVHVQNVSTGCDMLMLAAGATAPPHASQEYNFTYNIIKFEYDEKTENIVTRVFPRSWLDSDKDFTTDTESLGPAPYVYELGCPNFKSPKVLVRKAELNSKSKVHDEMKEQEKSTHKVMYDEVRPDSDIEEDYKLILLKFFRDLSQAQRREVFELLNVIPAGLTETLTIAQERHVVDALKVEGRLADLRDSIETVLITKE